MILVSNCCGASPRNEFEEEAGICSACGDHCDYEAEQEVSDVTESTHNNDVESYYNEDLCDI